MKTNLSQPKEDRCLSSWVTNSLRESILNGHFESGERLDQDLIAAELHVSRTPIREALKILASEGFVEILAYHGAFIPKFSRQDIRDVYEVRCITEFELVRLAVPVIPDEVLQHLEETFKQDAEAFQSGDYLKHYEFDSEFHNTIASYCHNKLLMEILGNLNNRIIRVRRFALHLPGTHLNESQSEHKKILDAMRSRDAVLAGQLMQEHLRNSAERIEKLIEE
jgi:DNA-binding GntR family transcriptional regulator